MVTTLHDRAGDISGSVGSSRSRGLSTGANIGRIPIGRLATRQGSTKRINTVRVALNSNGSRRKEISDRKNAPPPNKNLRRLTTGEIFWIDRKLHKLTWAKAARKHGLSENIYGYVEMDKRPPPIALPTIPNKLTYGMLCNLARRRHGRRLRETAEMFGISHTELLNREHESDERLVQAWRQLGYRF